jgi:hypothetical protein
MKQARIPRFTDRTKIGDQWTFVAIDPDTKLIPAYRVGKRHPETAVAFMADLSERLRTAYRFHRTRSAPMWTRWSGLSAQMWTMDRS